jgi:hypothetical protein
MYKQWDASLKIRNIVARWPGLTHDQTVFNNSVLKRNFENNMYNPYLLVSDSGYAIKPYLMTKLHEVHTPAENLYNESIIRTRNVIERQYGVWKRRFPILSTGITLSLQRALTVIVATAVLHNIAVEMIDQFPDEWFEYNVADDNDNVNHVGNNRIVHGGTQVRQLI